MSPDPQSEVIEKILAGITAHSTTYANGDSWTETHGKEQATRAILKLISEAYYEGRCDENVLARSIYDRGGPDNPKMIKNYKQWKTGKGFKP